MDTRILRRPRQHVEGGSPGLYRFTVTLGEGSTETTRSFEVNVANTNQALVLLPMPLQLVSEGDTLGFTLIAADADNDAVRSSLIYDAALLALGVAPGYLEVAAFDPAASGFTVRFGHAFDPAAINLCGTTGTAAGAADVAPQGALFGAVKPSFRTPPIQNWNKRRHGVRRVGRAAPCGCQACGVRERRRPSGTGS